MKEKQAYKKLMNYNALFVHNEEYALTLLDGFLYWFIGSKLAAIYPAADTRRILKAIGPTAWTVSRYPRKWTFDEMGTREDYINLVSKRLRCFYNDLQELGTLAADHLEDSLYDYFVAPPRDEENPDILGETLEEWDGRLIAI